MNKKQHYLKNFFCIVFLWVYTKRKKAASLRPSLINLPTLSPVGISKDTKCVAIRSNTEQCVATGLRPCE